MAELRPPLIVPSSRFKLFLILLIGLSFVAMSWWLLFFAPDIFFNRVIVQAAGVAGLVFFGLVSLYALFKMFDQRPGLIIDDEGFWDNSSGLASGRVDWAEVESISQGRVQDTKFILVKLRDHSKYIDRQRGRPFKRLMMRSTLKMYGTPVSISSNGLKISFDDLWALINEAYSRRRAC